MAHTVAVGEFEGPLGILLELVERNKLEVTAISVAEITTQYLERIRDIGERSPESLNEFLQLGTRLMYIKSLALLPQETSEERTEELRQLGLELEEYRRFQVAARELGRRTNLRTWERRVTERLEARDLPLPDLSLPQLADAFTKALKHLEPARETGVIRTHISLESVMTKLRRRLASKFELQELLDSCRDRLEIVVTFLALLELIHEGSARVTQAGQFAAITVEAAHA